MFKKKKQMSEQAIQPEKLSFKARALKKKRLKKAKINFELAKDWQPYQELEIDMVQLKNGKHMRFIRIAPNNITLQSLDQQIQSVIALATVFRSIPCDFKFHSFSMPINVDEYQLGWEKIMHDSVSEKKRNLSNFYFEQARLLGNGQQHTREFYVSITNEKVDLLEKQTLQVMNEFARIGVNTSVVKENKVVQVITKCFNEERVKSNEAEQLFQIRD